MKQGFYQKTPLAVIETFLVSSRGNLTTDLPVRI
jgi:hypothetical protein